MKKIFINKEQLETRVAMVENDILTEYEVERYDQERLVGSIFKGRIKNLENSLQAAFVDIGFQKNAFLHYWDMIPAAHNEGLFDQNTITGDTVAAMDANIGDSFGSTIKKSMKAKDSDEQERMRQEIERIPELYPVGSEVIVQVTKGPIGTKGPRVTTNLSIPGRFLVLLPHTSHIGVSKRIQNHKERDRLRNILRKMSLPEKMGCICRTLGDGKPEEYFHNDIEMLLDIWDTMERNRQTQRAPYCLYREPDLLTRSTRYFLTDSVDEVWIDKEDAFSKIRKTIAKISDINLGKLKHHTQHRPLFQHFGIAKQIDSIFERQVSLPSGGYICIDETEALIAIDINSGKARQGKDHPETILMTNLEAAEAIARQLRLRDIGGLVVIDFIDMRSKKDQMQVYRALKKAVQADKAKTKISPISQLGLLEMTRQREHQSLKDSLYIPCPNCDGKGVVKSMVSVSVEIQRKLQALLKRSKDKIEVRVICHPDILHRLRDEDARILRNMEKSLGGNLSFRADDSLHVEEFKVVNPKTMKEYR